MGLLIPQVLNFSQHLQRAPKHPHASRYSSNFDLFFFPGCGNNRIDFIRTNTRSGKMSGLW